MGSPARRSRFVFALHCDPAVWWVARVWALAFTSKRSICSCRSVGISFPDSVLAHTNDNDVLNIEFTHLTSFMVGHFLELSEDVKKDIIHCAWNHITSNAAVVKQTVVAVQLFSAPFAALCQARLVRIRKLTQPGSITVDHRNYLGEQRKAFLCVFTTCLPHASHPRRAPVSPVLACPSHVRVVTTTSTVIM